MWCSRIERLDRTKHAWPGAWQNPIFRNESGLLSSELIRLAVRETVRAWGPMPAEGFVSFVDPKKIASANPGYCFKMAGWRLVGETKGGHGRAPLLVFKLEGEGL